MARIQLIPTLATMAEIYRLPREGGAASPRFKRYLELAPVGVAEHGGYRWAIDQAGRRIKDLGAPSALRALAVS